MRACARDAFRVFHDKFICLQATDERNIRVRESEKDLERRSLLVVLGGLTQFQQLPVERRKHFFLNFYSIFSLK